MKEQDSEQREDTDAKIAETQPEYNFTKMAGGVRGKYYQAYREGHTVEVHKTDGTTIVQHFKLEEGAVMLEPDVRAYFPDSEAVNRALRSLIASIPTKPPRRVVARP